jgi:hypothetical protein
MTTVEPTLAANGEDVLCGACGLRLPLVRRARRRYDPQWNHGKAYVHVLEWRPEWRLVPVEAAMPAHLECARRIRRAPAPHPEPHLGAAFYIHNTLAPLALCACGALNRMDPKTLHVQAM